MPVYGLQTNPVFTDERATQHGPAAVDWPSDTVVCCMSTPLKEHPKIIQPDHP